ncbi:MAG: antitoxin family protein [Rubrobacter sp.]|nr:antitoxin family protein [Rubrobacteraceae bacterium]MBA3951815.1 antitoxin family protein [Rubrobacter sp.]
METLKAVFEKGKFRLLEPSEVPLSEGQQVRITVDTEATPDDVLALAEQVYAGLSEEEIDAIERIALDRDTFFGDRAS